MRSKKNSLASSLKHNPFSFKTKNKNQKKVTLSRPGIAPVALKPARAGATGANLVNTTFSDSAIQAFPAAASAAPFTGSFKPASPIAALHGNMAAGPWTLSAADVTDAADKCVVFRVCCFRVAAQKTPFAPHKQQTPRNKKTTEKRNTVTITGWSLTLCPAGANGAAVAASSGAAETMSMMGNATMTNSTMMTANATNAAVCVCRCVCFDARARLLLRPSSNTSLTKKNLTNKKQRCAPPPAPAPPARPTT